MLSICEEAHSPEIREGKKSLRGELYRNDAVELASLYRVFSSPDTYSPVVLKLRGQVRKAEDLLKELAMTCETMLYLTGKVLEMENAREEED